MKLISAVKHMGIRVWDSNNRTLGTIFGCIGGFALGLTVVLSNHANLPILGIPDSLIYKIIAVCLSTGIGGNLSSYIGASIDVLTNEQTIFDLIENVLIYCGCMQKRQSPQSQAVPVEGTKQHFPFITSAIPKERIADERHRTSLQGGPSEIYRSLIERLNDIQSQLKHLANQASLDSAESHHERDIRLSIAEPVEFNSESVARKLEEIFAQLQILQRSQLQTREFLESLENENRKLKQTLRDTQAANRQLAESVMQNNNPQGPPGVSPSIPQLD